MNLNENRMNLNENRMNLNENRMNLNENRMELIWMTGTFVLPGVMAKASKAPRELSPMSTL